MGAAALVGMGLLLASQAGSAYSQNQQIKGQQQALNQEDQIQGNFNKQIASIDQAQMQKEGPQAQGASIGSIASGISGALSPDTSATAQAAGAVAGTKGGASAGNISSVTQGAEQTGGIGANLLAALGGQQRQGMVNRQGIADWMAQRGQVRNLAQRQASNVFPWMLEEGATKGASIDAAAQLAGTLGAAAIGYGKTQKTKPVSTATDPGITTASVGSSGAGDITAPNSPGYVDPNTGEQVQLA